jgi:hypothetical protein
MPPHPACWLRWGCLANFLPGLAPNRDPPDLRALSSWDYRCEQQCLMVFGCFQWGLLVSMLRSGFQNAVCLLPTALPHLSSLINASAFQLLLPLRHNPHLR